MAIPFAHANDYLKRLLSERSIDEIDQALSPKFEEPESSMPRDHRISPEIVDQRWQMFPGADVAR